jgi:ATP-binding cassette subfamily B (MDR/TAP) protein 1
MFLVLGVLAFVTHLIEHATHGLLSARLSRRLRLATFRSILSQPILFFDDPVHSTGKLTIKLSVDATRIHS